MNKASKKDSFGKNGGLFLITLLIVFVFIPIKSPNRGILSIDAAIDKGDNIEIFVNKKWGNPKQLKIRKGQFKYSFPIDDYLENLRIDFTDKSKAYIKINEVCYIEKNGKIQNLLLNNDWNLINLEKLPGKMEFISLTDDPIFEFRGRLHDLNVDLFSRINYFKNAVKALLINPFFILFCPFVYFIFSNSHFRILKIIFFISEISLCVYTAKLLTFYLLNVLNKHFLFNISVSKAIGFSNFSWYSHKTAQISFIFLVVLCFFLNLVFLEIGKRVQNLSVKILSSFPNKRHK